jgi:hypothetical protein
MALLQVGEQGIALGAVLLLHHRAARDHHVVALAVQLDDLELLLLTFQVGRVAHRAHVHQGAGEEGAHRAELHSEAALDLAVDQALDRITGLEGLLQIIPGGEALGLLAGQAGDAVAVLHRIERDHYLVADRHLQMALGTQELASGDDALGLETGVDDHAVIGDLHHGTGHDGAGIELGGVQTLFKQFSEAFGHGNLLYLDGAQSRPFWGGWS